MPQFVVGLARRGLASQGQPAAQIGIFDGRRNRRQRAIGAPRIADSFLLPAVEGAARSCRVCAAENEDRWMVVAEEGGLGTVVGKMYAQDRGKDFEAPD